jgi:Holliday junction resolvase-like predicted endonuclease
MARLDFKEIPASNIADGNQDRFELFARDFLENLGYEVIQFPNRGADGGKDLIVEEKRTGISGVTTVRWLVSCKHKAHSGLSVTPDTEQNIRDRVETHECQGFLGFYSTVPSSGLSNIIDGLKSKIEVQIFDNEKIETYLLKSPMGSKLAERYFPLSTNNWKLENPTPARLFPEEPALNCIYCGKNLLDPNNLGIVVIWRRIERESEETRRRVEDIYWCCKGECDRILKHKASREGLIDGWEDIQDIKTPLVFAKWIV